MPSHSALSFWNIVYSRKSNTWVMVRQEAQHLPLSAQSSYLGGRSQGSWELWLYYLHDHTTLNNCLNPQLVWCSSSQQETSLTVENKYFPLSLLQQSLTSGFSNTIWTETRQNIPKGFCLFVLLLIYSNFSRGSVEASHMPGLWSATEFSPCPL